MRLYKNELGHTEESNSFKMKNGLLEVSTGQSYQGM